MLQLLPFNTLSPYDTSDAPLPPSSAPLCLSCTYLKFQSLLWSNLSFFGSPTYDTQSPCLLAPLVHWASTAPTDSPPPPPPVALSEDDPKPPTCTISLIEDNQCKLQEVHPDASLPLPIGTLPDATTKIPQAQSPPPFFVPMPVQAPTVSNLIPAPTLTPTHSSTATPANSASAKHLMNHWSTRCPCSGDTDPAVEPDQLEPSHPPINCPVCGWTKTTAPADGPKKLRQHLKTQHANIAYTPHIHNSLLTQGL